MVARQAEQSYAPWRQTLLTRAELAQLSCPDFGRSAASAAWLWFQILLFWWAAKGALLLGGAFGWAGMVVLGSLVGNRYYSLYILGHDGLHRRLHRNVRINDLFNDLVCIGPIGAVTHRNRSNHMAHHRHFATVADPDTYKYVSRRALGGLQFLLSLTAVPFVWRAVSNVYRSRSDAASRASSAAAQPARLDWRDLSIILGWQAALLVGLTLTFGWWGYVGMWLLPIYAFTFAADMLRVHCEHSVKDERALATLPGDLQWTPRCVSFMTGVFERALFAPMNMNHHAAHHLWPSIPWHNLPKATKLLQERASRVAVKGLSHQSFHTIRTSYLGWLRELRA